MRWLFILVFFLTNIGCAGKAVVIQAPYQYFKYAPSNSTEFGIVSYAVGRNHAVNESGRRSAYLLMQRSCEGSYRVFNTVMKLEPYTSTVQNSDEPVIGHKEFHFRCNRPLERTASSIY